MLLSFAQFEREVVGEHIRDKFAASRKKGMWMGGTVPLGYVVKDRKLVVNEAEAATVRMIFERFVKLGSITKLARELIVEGVRTKRNGPFDKGSVYRLLINRVYIGEAVHKGTAYPGEHQGIVDRALWDSRDGRTITVRVPLKIRRRGGRKMVVAPEGAAWVAPRPRVDSTLVKALARAFRWRKLLETGVYGTIEELAAAEKINSSYVGRVLRLTLLAPEIVEAILDGRQARE